MKYKIWCKQNNQYFASGSLFDSLDQCRDQLISYHSLDCDEASLEDQNLSDIINGFEWEVHDINGKVVDYKELEKVK